MDFKLSKDAGDSQQHGAHGEKKRLSSLLVLLLILVGGFTYLYFFTGLIKPQETEKAIEASAPAPQVVKIPLPPRDGEPAKPDDKATEKTAAVVAPAPTATAAAPAAKSVAAPAKSVPEPTSKAAPFKPKPKEEPIRTIISKPANKKTVVADKKNVPAKDSMKSTVLGGQVKAETAAKAKKASTEPWSLVVGNYVLEEALSADMGRVRKAGFKPVIKPAARIKTSMSRLFISEFNDRAAAQSTLEKLNRYTSDAFIIEQGGRFDVYAGSYLQSEAAGFEKERLKTAGFTVTIKHADIAIPSQSLSFGPFKNKKEADIALGKLKKTGLKATLSQK